MGEWRINDVDNTARLETTPRYQISVTSSINSAQLYIVQKVQRYETYSNKNAKRCWLTFWSLMQRN